MRNDICLISTHELATAFGFKEPSNAFYSFCRSNGISPVPGRRGWYDPKLVRKQLDAAQGIAPAEVPADRQVDYIAMRRARRAAQ